MINEYYNNELPRDINLRIIRSIRMYVEDMIDGNSSQRNQAIQAIQTLCDLLANCINTEIPEFERDIYIKIFATIGKNIETKNQEVLNSYVRELHKIEALFS